MKLLEEIKVSVYENVYSKRPEVMSFLEVITMCIHPIYAATINTIRRYHTEGDNEAAQKLKSQLPCFTPAGTFNGAHAIRNFLLPSNIICLDYDHVPDRQGRKPLVLLQLLAEWLSCRSVSTFHIRTGCRASPSCQYSSDRKQNTGYRL